MKTQTAKFIWRMQKLSYIKNFLDEQCGQIKNIKVLGVNLGLISGGVWTLIKKSFHIQQILNFIIAINEPS